MNDYEGKPRKKRGIITKLIIFIFSIFGYIIDKVAGLVVIIALLIGGYFLLGYCCPEKQKALDNYFSNLGEKTGIYREGEGFYGFRAEGLTEMVDNIGDTKSSKEHMVKMHEVIADLQSKIETQAQTIQALEEKIDSIKTHEPVAPAPVVENPEPAIDANSGQE